MNTEPIFGRDGQPLGEMDASIVRGNSSGALAFGILSLLFAGSGILGLIFANIARSKAKTVLFRAEVGKAKAGSVLGTIGLVFSIISLVGGIIAAIIMVIAMNTSFSYGF